MHDDGGAERPLELVANPTVAIKKELVANPEKLVANPERTSSFATNAQGSLPPLEIVVDFDDQAVEIGEEIGSAATGWRLEKRTDGYYRWRWQLKYSDGSPVTYVNQSGKTGYKRGSRYVGKNPEKAS